MITIEPYSPRHRAAVLDLSLRAWDAVFPELYRAAPSFVLSAFYPDGWRRRQLDDLASVLDEEPTNVDVAVNADGPVGWVCTRLHPGDSMGEVHVLAVDPDHQRHGVATALVDHSCDRARRAGMSMTMVETGGDPGHAPARSTYEAMDFVRWPVARYFKDLGQG